MSYTRLRVRHPMRTQIRLLPSKNLIKIIIKAKYCFTKDHILTKEKYRQYTTMETSKADAYEELRFKYAHSREENGTWAYPTEKAESLIKCKNQQILDDLKKYKHRRIGPSPPADNPQSAVVSDKRALEELRMKHVHLTDDDEVMNQQRNDFLADLKEKYAHQPSFLEAVEVMANSLEPLFLDAEKGEFFKRSFLLMTEPERIISFRVNWTNDQGLLQTNRGWRVEFSW